MQLGSDGPVHRDCLSKVPPDRKSVFRAGFRGVRSAPLPGGGTGGMNKSIAALDFVRPPPPPSPPEAPVPSSRHNQVFKT